jgi:hypothetical protein
MGVQLTGKSQLDGDEGVVSAIGHGLQVAGDAAVGLGVEGFSEAAGDLCDVNEELKDWFFGATEEDEGRPLDVGRQRQASNQAVRLKFKRPRS